MEVKVESLLVRQLEAAWRTGELIAFHKWSDEPTIFLVGFVRALSASTATFLTVDTCGRNEADLEVAIGEIQAVHRGTAYLMGLTYLNGMDDEVPRAGGRTARSTKTIRAALARASEGGTVAYVTFLSGEHGYFLVRDIDDDHAMLEALIDGMPDGQFTRRIDQMESLREESDREIAELILYRASQGLDA